MRKVMAPLAASLLLLATATTALAAKPDRYEETGSGSEYDSSTSELCGFDVWLTYRTRYSFTQYSDGSSVETFDAQRFRRGPGGSITQVVHYVWVNPDPFQIIGDPESGSWQEIFRAVLHGSRIWSTPGEGVIYRDAGYYDATVVLTITPDGETVEIVDEVARGQQPSTLGEEEANALLCDALG